MDLNLASKPYYPAIQEEFLRSGALGVKSREKEIRRSRALEVEKAKNAKLVPEIAQSVFNAIVLAAVYLLAVEIYQLPPYIISSY